MYNALIRPKFPLSRLGYRYGGTISKSTVLDIKFKRALSTQEKPAKPSLMIASIGNPEPDFKGSRHSVGHLILDLLVTNLDFSEFSKHRNIYKGVYSVSKNEEWNNLFLYKSNETYMNVQGEPVKRNWQQFSRLQPNPSLVVIHDDIQLPLGKIQVRLQGTSARGHNGLRSIDAVLGKTYTKISIGVGKPPNKFTADYVLAKFKRPEVELLEYEVISQVIETLRLMSNGEYINKGV